MTANSLLDVEVEVLRQGVWCPGWLDPTTWRKRDGRWFVTVRYQPAPQSNHIDTADQDYVRRV